MDQLDADQSDLTSLVRRAQNHDASAFAQLVLRFQNLSLGFAYSLLRDWHQAEDATQESFLTAFQALPSLQEPASFPGWLRTIVHHRCHRILRRYDLDAGPIDLAQDTSDKRTSPSDAVVNSEQRDVLSATIESLAPQLRQAVVMFYLRGVSQREMSAFLGVPVSTVNNRLHEARAVLKKRMLTMVTKNIANHRLDEGFAENIGRIISVRGPVVEAKFDAPARADVFDILAITDGAGKRVEKVKVAQRLPDGTVRGVGVATLADVAVGASIANIGGTGDGMTPHVANPAMSDQDVAAAVRTLGRTPELRLQFMETGIKAIDLFCPLPAGGNIGLFGIQGVGRIVLVEELFHRLSGRAEGLRLFYLVHHNEPDSVRGMLWQEAGYPGDVAGAMQVVWILSDLATDVEAAARIDPFDAVIYCHPLLGIRGDYPAVDPLRSDSLLLQQGIVEPAHRDIAECARGLLRQSRELMADHLLMELIACHAYRQARQRAIGYVNERLGQLGQDDRRIVERARKLEKFLTSPFFVAEKFNGKTGKFVPIGQTLRGCKMILDGDLDTVNETALAYIGTIDEAIGQ